MPQLFISYARSDDEAFVNRLAAALRQAGHAVWLDRSHMLSRGLAFQRELQEAIASSERVLAVIGPAALRSAPVRLEWESALACDKPLLPLLRLGEHADLPDYLVLEGATYRHEAFGRQHTLDFREDNGFEAQLAELLRLLAEPVQPMGLLGALTPAIAPHVLPRADVMRPLVGALLGTSEDDTPPKAGQDGTAAKPLIADAPIIALVGMGGSGKTTLAAAAVRTGAVRRHFAQGLVWLHQPHDERAGTTSALLDTLAQALGLDAEDRSHEAKARGAIRKALHRCAYLLVLDDVVERDSANVVRSMLGPACRLLVTTRHSDLAQGLGAVQISVPMLQRFESLRLLERWSAGPRRAGAPGDDDDASFDTGHERTAHAPIGAGRDADADAVGAGELDAVASLLGDHPLALAMAGASMRGPGAGAWRELLELLRAEGPGVLGDAVGAPVGDYAHRSVAAALHASVQRLRQPQDREHLLSLALFPPGTRLPLPMLQRYLGATGLTAPLASALLRRLQAAALLTLEDDGSALLHPLVADALVRASSAPPTATLHRRWVQAYAPPLPAAWVALAVPAAEAPYFWQHWGRHLAEADEPALIAHLACEAAWLSQSINTLGLAQTLAQWQALPDAAGARPVLEVMALCGPRSAASHFDWLFECLARVPPEQAALRRRLAEQAAARPGPWVRPLAPGLARSGAVLVSTLKGVIDRPLSAVMWLDDERVITVGYDSLLTVWHAVQVRPLARLDLYAGQLLHAVVDANARRVYWCSSRCYLGCVDIGTDPRSGATTLEQRWRTGVDGFDATKPIPEVAGKNLADAVASAVLRHLLAVHLLPWQGHSLLLAVASDGTLHSFDPATGELRGQQMLAPATYAPYGLVSIAPLGGDARPAGREGVLIGLGGGLAASRLLVLCAQDDPLAATLPPWPEQPNAVLGGGLPAAVRVVESPGRLGAVAVSADGLCMALANWSSMQQGGGAATIFVTPWGAATGESFDFTLPSRGVRHLMFGADRLLVICHLDAVIEVVDLGKRRHLGRHNCSAGSFGAAMSPSGRWLASVHDDAALRLWDSAVMQRPQARETWHHRPIVAMALARTRSLWHTKAHVLRRLHERDQGAPVSTWSVLGTALRHLLWPARELLAFCEGGELSRWHLQRYGQVFSNALETALFFGNSQPYRTGRFDRDGALFLAPAARLARHCGETRRDALWLDVMQTGTLRFQRRLLTHLRVRGEAPGEGNCPLAIAPGGNVVVAKPDRDLLVWHTGRRREMGGWWQRWRDRHLTAELLVEEDLTTDTGTVVEEHVERCLQMSFSADGRWLGLLFRLGSLNTLGLIATDDLRRPHAPSGFGLGTDWAATLRYAATSEPRGPLPQGVEAFVMNHRASEVWLAAGDGRVARWTPSSGSVLNATEGAGHAPRQLGLLAGELLLAVATERGLALYDSTSLRLLWIVSTEAAVTAVLALDLHRFALGFGDGRVCFFEWVPASPSA